MILYSPADWYWQVDSLGVYGSARGGLVANTATDAAYLKWSAINGPGSIVASTGALDALLTEAGLPATGLTTPTAAQILAYAGAKVNMLLEASRNYTVSGVGSPISCDCYQSAADVQQAIQWGSQSPAPTGTMAWIDNNYATFSMTATEAIAFAQAVGAYKLAVYAVMAAAVPSITGGTITTTAQVDALAWPA
jgi:hypothetical protein